MIPHINRILSIPVKLCDPDWELELLPEQVHMILDRINIHMIISMDVRLQSNCINWSSSCKEFPDLFLVERKSSVLVEYDSIVIEKEQGVGRHILYIFEYFDTDIRITSMVYKESMVLGSLIN